LTKKGASEMREKVDLVLPQTQNGREEVRRSDGKLVVAKSAFTNLARGEPTSTEANEAVGEGNDPKKGKV